MNFIVSFQLKNLCFGVITLQYLPFLARAMSTYFLNWTIYATNIRSSSNKIKLFSVYIKSFLNNQCASIFSVCNLAGNFVCNRYHYTVTRLYLLGFNYYIKC